MSSPSTVIRSSPPNHRALGFDAGPVLPPSYGNYVWLDANLNGVQDTGEVGVNGARIDFYQDNDGITGPSTGDRWVGFTISGPDNDGNPGFYLFSDPTRYSARRLLHPRDTATGWLWLYHAECGSERCRRFGY
ncbi:SdrD B-like domain-containing protein [Chloroflexus sp.]|uniref:SdrD B-like domain-containing protein n=1 Tax=Chloroflexus sp. TaxID=1904827 RepID=UPI0027E4179B|nr:SdrD B-like domain-containing protein [Chloroflexus sp.]